MAKLAPIDPAEREDFILSRKAMHISTLDPDGSPHLQTVWFGLIEHQVVFWTQKTFRGAHNLRRDPRIALLWESGTEYSELRGMTVNGQAELVEDDEGLLAIGQAVIERNYPLPDRPDYREMALSGTRVGIRVVEGSSASWDFARSRRVRPPT